MEFAWCVVGAKCVAVVEHKPEVREFFASTKFPRLETVYTVRTVEKMDDGSIGLRFEEIINSRMPLFDHEGFLRGIGETQFAASDFKPLEARKTSIESFESILTSPEVLAAKPLKVPEPV